MVERAPIALEDLCRLGGSLAFSIENALTLCVISRLGHEPAEEVQFRAMRAHQELYFLAGLEKLGLDAEPSDPVRCAKYHVLSNYLGGLKVRYGESEGRAWVIYDTPYVIDSPWMPSIGVAAIRPELQLRTMAAWHANNGVLLGNPRLAYAQTMLVARGDACDAGYFFEADHELVPSERLQLRFDEGLPADLELHPPELDPTVWPIERQAKAWRNFFVAYLGGRLYWLKDVLGEETTAELVEHAVRITLLQNRGRMKATLGLGSARSTERALALWAGWHEAWGDEVEVERGPGCAIEAVVHRSRLHEAGEFAPPADPLPAAFEAAIDRAWATVIAYDCPGVEAIAGGSMQSVADPWHTRFREAA